MAFHISYSNNNNTVLHLNHLFLSYTFNIRFLYLSASGWNNAQLAQQLEERERRIKGHLDMAAKGEGLLSTALF